VDLRTALLRLEAAVPSDRTLVSDGGQYVWDAWKLLHVAEPQAFMLTVNFGSIGLGMGSAIGAAFGRPGHPVLLLTGDGGFANGGLAELNTAVRHRLDLITVVFNNRTYGPEYVHLRDRDMDPSLVLFDWPDFAAVADSLGGRGFAVRNLNDLDALQTVIAGRDRPLLVNVHLDPNLVATEHERA
jgi:acetolactate synthase-1/2/3 large subunit